MKASREKQPAAPQAASAGNAAPASTGRTGAGQTSTATPSLALPKGGGAIRGIGDKFTANPATGTGSWTVPIATTPGRGGMHPELALAYSSSSGNSPFGLGWELGVPNISRRTSKSIPAYDSSDVFVLSGAEDLTPSLKDVAGSWVPDVSTVDLGGVSYQVTRYRPRTEGLFARIERFVRQSDGDVHWGVWDRKGGHHMYGQSAAARIADPTDGHRVFRWLLESSDDDKGNLIRYSYKAETLDGVDTSEPFEVYRCRYGTPSANKYLKRIQYGNKVTNPQIDADWSFEVVFDYGEHTADTPNETATWAARSDAFSSARAGFEIRTYRLCQRVLMFHRFAELGSGPYLVRSTSFSYDHDTALTKLVSATQMGHRSGQAPIALPAVTFEYEPFVLTTTPTPLPTESLRNLPAGLFGGGGHWIDLDSEGLSGVLYEQGDAWHYVRNLGEGNFAPAERVAQVPSTADLGQGGQQFLDVTGDGVACLTQFGGDTPGFQSRTMAGAWGPHRAFRGLPNLDWTSPELRFVDLNGDGFADVFLATDVDFRWYPSRGVQGFGDLKRVPKPLDERQGPTLMFADRTKAVFFADMSGDGLADIVRVQNGEVVYWPNLGRGRFGAKVVMAGAPIFDGADTFEPRRVQFADVDGSGTTDVLYLGARGVQVYYNHAGNRLVALGKALPLPAVDQWAQVAAVDLLGTGTTCLVWSSPLPGAAARPVWYIDLVGGKKPHLLVAGNNGTGLRTELEYRSSTYFYLKDRAAGVPWVSRLPFPVHVVSKVTVVDAVADTLLVHSYLYRHGFYDGTEREFRGFGFVEQVDAESYSNAVGAGQFSHPPPSGEARLEQEPVVTRTWYHTGQFAGRGQISKQYAAEYFAGDSLAQSLADTVLPVGLAADEARQACRALRGQFLRQEVYSSSDLANLGSPYLVTEQNHAVSLLQPKQSQEYAVFWPHAREALVYHYEKNTADPRILHTVTLEVDAWGNVLRQAEVAYKRRAGQSDAVAGQDVQWTKVTDATYLNLTALPGDGGGSLRMYVGLPVETRVFEPTVLTAPDLSSGVYSFDGLSATIASAVSANQTATRALTQTRYCSWSTGSATEAALGAATSPVLPYRTWQLATTTSAAVEVYGLSSGDTESLLGGSEIQLVSGASGTWWAVSGVQGWSPSSYYQPTSYTDPSGAQWQVGYDSAKLVVTSVTDPFGNATTVGNATTSGYDYRAMAPYFLTDLNGNRSVTRYDALGVPVKVAIMGKSGSLDGDLADTSNVDEQSGDAYTALFTYGFGSTANSPSWVQSLHRQAHGGTPTWEESKLYIDGSGREALRKVRCKADPEQGSPDGFTWVGTGKTVFNNKGNPVKQFEPYFAASGSWETDSALSTQGVTPILVYDALGRLVRTEFPDGSYSKVTIGAWQEAHWDQNDCVEGSAWYTANTGNGSTALQQATAAKVYAHRNSPAAWHLDALGRVVAQVQDPKLFTNDPQPQPVYYTTRFAYDVLGRPLTVVDARNITSMTWTYDLLGQAVKTVSPDTGTVRTLFTVDGLVGRSWTANSDRVRRSYDGRRRLTAIKWLSASQGATEMTVERLFYGEAYTSDAAAHNALGRLVLHYDGAGLDATFNYDFEGRPVAQSRYLSTLTDATLDWTALDSQTAISSWSTVPGANLGSPYTTATSYDALGRVTSQTSINLTSATRTYNLRGLLASVAVSRTGQATATVVSSIAYNAKGQRTAIAYGNTTSSMLTYDSSTFRLVRQQTVRSGDSAVLQDLQLTYDPVGNVVHVHDDGISPSFFDNQQQQPDWDHTYDPLHRLVTATGRESAIDDQDPVPSWVTSGSGFGPTPPPSGTAARNYVQQIAYDPVGNLSSVQHFVPGQSSASWTRSYSYPADSNRLGSDTVGGVTSSYGYDSAGNMSSMPHLPGSGATAGLQWSWANQLAQTYSSSSAVARYAYGGDGQRVVKRFGSLSGSVLTPSKVTVYLPGGFEITGSFSGGALQVEWQSLAVMDDRTCVARFEVKAVDGGVATGESAVLRYQVGNHLGSSCLETTDAGEVLTREEYYPYGGTAYAFLASGANGFSVKRYRYAGKECDSENGLYYFGARYFAAWIGRWTAGDPVFHAGRSGYEYCSGNPVSRVDPDGAESEGVVAVLGYEVWLVRQPPPAAAPPESSRAQAGVRASNWLRNSLAFADRVWNAASEPAPKAAGRGMATIGNAPADTPSFRVQQHQAGRNFQARLRSGETAANITGSGLGALASIVARLRGGDALDVANWSQLGASVGQVGGAGLAAVAGIVGRRTRSASEFGIEAVVAPKGGLLDPKSIRFSQDSIRPGFKNPEFGTIDDLAEGLRTGRVKPGDVEPIRLVEREGHLITIDNRRLQAFREAGVDVPTRKATPAEIEQAIQQGKFSAGPLGTDTTRIRGGR